MPATVDPDLLSELVRLAGSAREARWILEEVTGERRPFPGSVSPAQAAAARAMARRRRAGEPLQYVLGHWAFRSLDLLVDRRVLVPRPETEQVVEVALAELASPGPDRPGGAVAGAGGAGPVVVDLGTGSGAIALSVAAEAVGAHPSLEVWAAEVDAAALAVAEANRRRLADRHPAAGRAVRLVAGSWWAALPAELTGRIDLVVSNPPYVAEHEWEGLQPEVRREPRGALVAGPGSDGTPGLADVEEVLRGAARRLAPGGVVVVELAPHQARPARALAATMGLDRVRVAPDLAGRPRALVARRPATGAPPEPALGGR